MNSEQNIKDHILFPLQLLRAGSFHMLLFVVVVAAICVCITDFLQLNIARALVHLKEHEDYSQEILANLFGFGRIMSWLIVIPVLIASQALPVRLIFLHDKLPLFEAIKHSINALKLSVRGLFYALRWAPIYLVPLIAVMLLERVLQEYLVIPHYRYAYYTITLVIGVGVAFKIVPYLLIPITSVLSLSEPRHTHYKIAQIFDRNTATLLTVAALSIAGSAALSFYLPPLHRIAYISIFLSYWYYVTLIFSGLITRELAKLEVEAYQMQQQGRH